MTSEEIKKWVAYIKERMDKHIPLLDDKEHMLHWMGRLFVGRTLFQRYDQYEPAYSIMREIYLNNEIRYDRDLFGSYEDYIEEKVNFFKEMAELTYVVTKEAARSIPFIDEALIMLDGAESVSPYINAKEFKKLREQYVKQSIDEME